MTASAIFILDENGKPLLSRNYRGDVPMSVVEHFPQLLLDFQGVPVMRFQGVQYLYVPHQNIYILAVCKDNANAAAILQFLHYIKAVMKDFFKEIEEESIRDNFVVMYELLDEMMDFGHPQLTDPKILQEYITQESHELDIQSRQSNVMTNAISWRPEGIFYKKNELFLDVIESYNVVISADNEIISSEINGKVNAKAYLSGMPRLKLGLNDSGRLSKSKPANGGGSASEPAEVVKKPKGTSKLVDLEDIRFHQCVELDQFEKDRTISFIPPDGNFELMSYRAVNYKVRPLFLVKADIDVRNRSRVIVTVAVKSQYKRRSVANAVEISIPVPPDADSPRFKAQSGSVVYAPEHNAIVWRIKQYPGGQEYSMRAELQLSSIQSADIKGDGGHVDSSSAYKASSAPSMNQPIRVKFDIPYLVVSGLQVRYLKVDEPKMQYQSLPWVRYLTESGPDYLVRIKR